MGVCRQTMDRNNPVHTVIWLPGSEGQFHPLSDVTSETTLLLYSLYVSGRYSNCEAGERLMEMCPLLF
jgi:hypothetical protein